MIKTSSVEDTTRQDLERIQKDQTLADAKALAELKRRTLVTPKYATFPSPITLD